MPMVISPAGELGKELRKWEQHHSKYSITEDGNSQPGNPYVFRAYPAMLYRAQKRENGKVECLTAIPHPYASTTMEQHTRAVESAEAFNKSNQLIVQNEQERDRAFAQGWRVSPVEALRAFEALEQDIAQAAAEAAFTAKRMTPKAQDELAAADDTTHEHVVDITTVSAGKKRGRKPKAVTSART